MMVNEALGWADESSQSSPQAILAAEVRGKE